MLLRSKTDLSGLTSSLHCVAACSMGTLALGALLPIRVDTVVTCSSSAPVDFGLAVYATLHVAPPCMLSLVSACRGCDRRLTLRLTQLIVLAMFASIASVRRDILCRRQSPRLVFFILYVWATTAFVLCHRVERALGFDAEQPDKDDDDGRCCGSSRRFLDQAALLDASVDKAVKIV